MLGWFQRGPRVGPFQLEAAVQSAHFQRFWGKSTPWREIALLYRELNRQAPRAGSRVAEAVAWLEAGKLAECEFLLMQQPLPDYQPWWMAQAHLERSRGNFEASRLAFERARAMTLQQPIQRHIDGLICALATTPTREGEARSCTGAPGETVNSEPRLAGLKRVFGKASAASGQTFV